MIEIDESEFGYMPDWSDCNWLLSDEDTGEILPILEQLYAQMLGWA